MPASLAAVKRKIQSTKSTRQITAAMQMVSTAKLNQIQHHTKTYQVYADKVKAILAGLVQSQGATSLNYEQSSKLGTLFLPRPVKKTGLLVITSDRGLVGSYNSNVIKATLDLMHTHQLQKNDTVLLTVGKTGTEFFKKRGLNVAYDYTGVSDVPTYQEVRGIVHQAVKLYLDGVYDQLFISYGHYVNRIMTTDLTAQMLPISKATLRNADASATDQPTPAATLPVSEYEIEPSLGEMIDMLVPQYAESLIYGAILDAKTAEHASSANAMRAASDNADDIIATLELQYNRARQAAITTEITEITGGMTAQE